MTVSNLNGYEILETQVHALHDTLRTHFISPILTGLRSICVGSALVIQPASRQPPDAIFKHLSVLVRFLSTAFNKSVLDTLIPTLLPALTDELLSDFLSSNIPGSIFEPAAFEDLVNEVTEFNNLIVVLEWSTETSLSTWVPEAPHIWFARRRATFLEETRSFVIRLGASPKSVVISHGVDIMIEPKSGNDSETKVVNDTDHKPAESNATSDENDDDDVGDGWGFDVENPVEDFEGEDGAEESEGVAGGSWAWGDENDDSQALDKSLYTSFPYCLSPIPEGLMEIVGRVLTEGKDLQSATYSRHGSSNDSFSRTVASRSVGHYPSMTSSIFATHRAIVQLFGTDMKNGQRMRLSNDFLYLSHRLNSDDPTVIAEKHRLWQCGVSWFNRELVSITMCLANIASHFK